MEKTVFKQVTRQLMKTVVIAATALFIAGVINAQTTIPDIEMMPVEGNDRINSFNVGKFEVTQGQWKAVMGNNPAANQSGDNYPVESVSWYDARDFIAKLNQLTGKQYRMLTEAEWEYAARGGNKSQGFEYSGSNNANDVAWTHANSNGNTQPVGTKQPNELGVYDMSGNVWEWCAEENSGSLRSIRGGAMDAPAMGSLVGEREFNTVSDRNPSIGFRLAHP
jgi:formylglycine-generating enzyme required for sulfatase activity